MIYTMAMVRLIFAIAVSLAQQWENFCLAIEQPELLIDPKFRSGGLRFDNANELNKLIAPWLNERTQDEIVSHLQKWTHNHIHRSGWSERHLKATLLVAVR